jgi:hypothetical protein
MNGEGAGEALQQANGDPFSSLKFHKEIEK